MDRSMVILVEPSDAEDDVGGTEDAAQHLRRRQECERLHLVLLSLGFRAWEGRNSHFSFECEGLNWHGSMHGRVFELSPTNLALLEGRAAELCKLRHAALAKLTTDEQVALGLLRQP